MAEIIDSYTANNDNARKIYTGTYTRIGQSWTGVAGKRLTSVRLTLIRFGAPAGAATISIYAHSGVYGTSSVPTGAALATATLTLADVPTSYAWVEVPFVGAGQIVLEAVPYCLEYRYASGDASNCVAVGTKETAPAHAGNAFWWYSSYAAQSGKDVRFEVYGEAVGCPRQAAHLRRMML